MTQHITRFALALLLIALPALGDLMAADLSQLDSLRKERKFMATSMHTGPDGPEDGPQLIELVNSAIDDVMAMPEPFAADVVRRRLQKLIDDVDQLSTEDRDQTYIYAVRIWRA